MSKKKCPNCGRTINGHPNKKFCGSKCKDRYHNKTNPRGYFTHLAKDDADTLIESEDGWDGHKNSRLCVANAPSH